MTLTLCLSNGAMGIAKENEPCTSDADCVLNYEYCKQMQSNKEKQDIEIELNEHATGLCTHKSLFPMLETEYYGLFLIMGLLTFTNIGGMAGAGIVIPIMIALYQFDTRKAISLSHSSQTVSTFTRYVRNFNEPHPLKNGTGTLVDYNITILMLPGIIFGASFGSIVNLMLPDPVIIASFVFFNFCSMGLGLFNFCKVRRKDRLKKA